MEFLALSDRAEIHTAWFCTDRIRSFVGVMYRDPPSESWELWYAVTENNGSESSSDGFKQGPGDPTDADLAQRAHDVFTRTCALVMAGPLHRVEIHGGRAELAAAIRANGAMKLTVHPVAGGAKA